MNRKLFTTVGMLLLLAVLLLAALQYERHRHSRIMIQQLHSKTSELDRRLAQLAVVPRLLAEHPDVEAVLADSRADTAHVANVVLQQAQIDSNAEFAFLLDRSGTTIASSNYRDEISFVGQNYGFRPYFTGALDGQETTFFAVGATTGIPGYFVANPVVVSDKVVGVVVVKFELAGLFDAWRVEPYQWLATDELGVVILSTRNAFLYMPTRPLTNNARDMVLAQRKYVISENTYLHVNGETAVVHSPGGQRSLLIQSQSAYVEKWQLLLLLEARFIWGRAFMYVLAGVALLAIVGLLYRNLRAKQRLAKSEKRYALALEQEVQLRTDELRSAQERLISESNFAMLGRMSAAINHEINQPLASLRFNFATMRKLISESSPDIDQLRQIVVETDRTTKRIGRVVTTLRNLTGGRRQQHKELALSLVIKEVADTIKRERPAMSACLTVSVDTNNDRIVGNEVLLQQALLNLLYNAFDAVVDETDPRVELIVSHCDDMVIMQTVDNGCGVTDSVAENLFKPFVTDESKKNGLGLGLTLVELIAADHGGQLCYTPTNQLNGSVFTLKIPVDGPVLRM